MDLFLAYFMISQLTATTEPLDTENIWHWVLTLLIKKAKFQITLISSLFKPVNMRSRNFRNGVAWSYTGYEAHSSCSFLYRCSRTNELLEHQKLDQMILQKPEHSICTKKYSYCSEINMGVTLRPWVLLIWQNGKI